MAGLEDILSLKICNKPSYLSPSSLMLAEGCPNKFYMERLAETKAPREPQGPAAAAGSSFDAHIKAHLAKELGVESKIRDVMLKEDESRAKYDSLLDLLFYSSVEEPLWGEVKAFGAETTRWYKSIPFVKETKWAGLEEHFNYTILTHGVPLYMKLDASVSIGQTTVPFDWKVKGYGSTNGASPSPGYIYLYDNTKGIVSGAHDLWHSAISMDSIDARWAAQLATYGWGLGRPIGSPFQAVIDCLVYRPTGWRVARYIGWITQSFQKELVRRYSFIWEAIQNGSYTKGLIDDIVMVEYMAKSESWWG